MAATAPEYSFSRITTFEQCARRFRYRYLDCVKEAFDSIEGFMGRRVHDTIEWLFGERLLGRTPSAAETVARYCDRWDEEVVASVRQIRVVKRGENAESYRRLGAELLTWFHRERFSTDRLETIGAEQHFRVELDGRYRFQGYIDRLARDENGLVHVIDYKTGRRAPQRFEGKEAEQLEAYALAIFLQTDAPELELVIEFLRAGKILRRRVERSRAPELERRLAARIATLEDATVYPPSPGALCDWCGYNDICEAFATRARVAIAS
jgi:putative RecB family exonuclease